MNTARRLIYKSKDSGMDNSITTSITLMAVSGISFLAYKHPKGYSKLYPFLAALNMTIISVILAWDFASEIATAKLTPFLKPDKIDEATKLSKTFLIAPGYSSLFYSGLMMYLTFLLFLPEIVEHKEERGAKL
jgi:F0F1-type ATP synthase assembly protein I